VIYTYADLCRLAERSRHPLGGVQSAPVPETPAPAPARPPTPLIIDGAYAKAEALLLRHLDDTQRAQYAAHGWFEVQVETRCYRIRQGISGNVSLRDPQTREPTRIYCIHPRLSVPTPDVMLAQLLTLRYDEARFLRIANASEPHRRVA